MVWRLTWELVLFYVFLGALLFGTAGTFDWWGGWVFLAEMIVGGVAVCWWLLVHDPGLMRERLDGFQKAQVFADRVLTAFIQFGFFAWVMLMALDRRWQISHMSRGWNYAGALLAASFYPVCWRIFRENSFAAPVVKIQKDRNQTVVTSGPYRFVRHPMYAGSIVFFVGLPLLFGSWPGLLGVPFFMGLLVLRIPIEERALRENIAGYDDYAARVRYRLIPGLW